jgi:muramidase (phage lysozyme)
LKTDVKIEFENMEFAHNIVQMPVLNLTKKGNIEFIITKGEKILSSLIVGVSDSQFSKQF